MREGVSAFVSGLVFALGLGLSGMTRPGKVVGFLDFTGAWDPSLIFVMVGAIAVYAVGYRFSVKRPKPLFTDSFHVPTLRRIDRRLIAGSAIFGAGWGLAGFCPGPALTSLVSLRPEPLIFVAAMLGGMWVFEWTQRKGSKT